MAPGMAELPTERPDSSTAFANVGIDWFQPFTVKLVRGTEKFCSCLFTCQSVRAVHKKIVPNLDTESCRNTIMRIIARRGKPMTMISDIGTNFVGAVREFKVYVEPRKNWGIFSSARNPIEVQSTRSTSLWRSVGATGQKLKAGKVCSVREPTSYGRFSQPLCNLLSKQWRPDSWQQSGLTWKIWTLLPQTTSCLVTKSFVYSLYHKQRISSINENSFDKQKITQISSGTDSEWSICQLWTVGTNWNENLKGICAKVISFG